MSKNSAPKPPPGWYPKEDGTNGKRYWDGKTWTDRQKPPLAKTPLFWVAISLAVVVVVVGTIAITASILMNSLAINQASNVASRAAEPYTAPARPSAPEESPVQNVVIPQCPQGSARLVWQVVESPQSDGSVIVTFGGYAENLSNTPVQVIGVPVLNGFDASGQKVLNILGPWKKTAPITSLAPNQKAEFLNMEMYRNEYLAAPLSAWDIAAGVSASWLSSENGCNLNIPLEVIKY